MNWDEQNFRLLASSCYEMEKLLRAIVDSPDLLRRGDAVKAAREYLARLDSNTEAKP